MPFYRRVPLPKKTTEKSWYPYSKLSTEGPRFGAFGTQGPVPGLGRHAPGLPAPGEPDPETSTGETRDAETR